MRKLLKDAIQLFFELVSFTKTALRRTKEDFKALLYPHGNPDRSKELSNSPESQSCTSPHLSTIPNVLFDTLPNELIGFQNEGCNSNDKKDCNATPQANIEPFGGPELG